MADVRLDEICASWDCLRLEKPCANCAPKLPKALACCPNVLAMFPTAAVLSALGFTLYPLPANDALSPPALNPGGVKLTCGALLPPPPSNPPRAKPAIGAKKLMAFLSQNKRLP